jgi:hypothetical protein
MTTRVAGRAGSGAGLAAVICLAALSGVGCAETLQQAAKSAAPAAVEGAAEEAQHPDTRADIARVLSDPEIRSAASSLSSAVLAGALDGLTDEQRVQQLSQLADAMVRRLGAGLAKSMRDDIGPELSKSLADAVDRSLERALDVDTEQRLEAMTLAITRGMVKGVGEALVAPNGQPSPWARPLGQIARDVTAEAAFGLDDAVHRVERNEGDGPPARVLAALGTLAAFTQALPLLFALGLAWLLLGCALPVAWLALRLRHYKRQSLASEEATLTLARAIKGTEPLAWSAELREHLARATKDGAGADELSRLLREHAELRWNPRDRAPNQEGMGRGAMGG